MLAFETLIIISHDDDKSYADVDDNDEDVEDIYMSDCLLCSQHQDDDDHNDDEDDDDVDDCDNDDDYDYYSIDIKMSANWLICRWGGSVTANFFLAEFFRY